MTESVEISHESGKNSLKSKLGGAHTTIIGGRTGKKLVRLVSQHPEIKKIIPSVISVKGTAGGKLSGKVLRADARGKPEDASFGREEFPGTQARNNGGDS